MMPKKFVVKKDIIISAGTVLKNVDGETAHYCRGNYGLVLGLTKDTSGVFIYGIDELDEKVNEWFEEVIE
jgi:hypothetical protein